jgi:hypothetical protein
MEVINHVIAIAEKNHEWRSLEDSLGLGVHKNNSVLFDKKKQKPLFFISNTTIQNSCSSNIIKESLVQQIAIKAHFLRISGYDIASRLEIVGKGNCTDEEIGTNYITLPHFVTLKDEIMRTLQKIKTNKPNNKIMLKTSRIQTTKVLTVVVLLSLGKESTKEVQNCFAENAMVVEHAEAVKVAAAAKKSILVLYVLG